MQKGRTKIVLLLLTIILFARCASTQLSQTQGPIQNEIELVDTSGKYAPSFYNATIKALFDLGYDIENNSQTLIQIKTRPSPLNSAVIVKYSILITNASWTIKGKCEIYANWSPGISQQPDQDVENVGTKGTNMWNRSFSQSAWIPMEEIANKVELYLKDTKK
ncbi:MAG: hypothetical protein NT144_00230 [Bacteroidia bacterium]|nr:hypothetical protein [Bacteroidia bacterium]